MKNPVLLLVVCSLLVFFTADLALAEWQIQYDAEANRVLHLGGQTRRGSFATKEQCQAYWESQPYFERQHSRCVGYDSSSSTSWGGTPSGGGLSSSEQMAVGIFGSLFSGIMQGIMSEPSPTRSYQPPKPRELTPEEKAARAKKMEEYKLKRQERLQRPQDLQDEERRQRALERQKLFAEKNPAGYLAWKNKMIAEGKTEMLVLEESLGTKSVSGGELEAFKWEGPEALEPELQALGTGRYDTSSLSSWQRLLCATHFSNEALKAIKNGDEERARYLNEQAEKVSSGQMIELECEFAALPQPPEPEKPEPAMAAYVNLLEKTQKDIKTLQDIEIKIRETEVKKKQAESKKEKAEKMIAESRALDTAKPENKAKSKSLEDEARRLLQEAQNELELANKTQQELLNQQAKIHDELEQVQAEIEWKAGVDRGESDE